MTWTAASSSGFKLCTMGKKETYGLPKKNDIKLFLKKYDMNYPGEAVCNKVVNKKLACDKKDQLL